MAEGTNSRDDDDRLKQENINQESGGEDGKELHRDGCGMISIKLDEFIFWMRNSDHVMLSIIVEIVI